MLINKVLLNRYQIIKELGSGGFGDTYLAKDTALPNNPFCVVKHLLPKFSSPDSFSIAKSLFEREAKMLYRLGKHDRIPSLYAHFEEEQQFYLVQDFIDGNDLTQEISGENKLSEKETIKIIENILEVLAFVHEEKVIHRDIKPDNIMRRKKDGQLVLIDFGAVKEIGALTVNSQGETSLTLAIGTPGYMPNEQANGKPKLASDIFALGMIGIQALTGLRPHLIRENPQTGELLWQDYATVSHDFADFLNKMVKDNWKERYQSASEALKDLKVIISGNIVTKINTKINKLMPQFFWPKIIGGLSIVALVIFIVNQTVEMIDSSKRKAPDKVKVTNNQSQTQTQGTKFQSQANWRSQSGKTILPELDSICHGENEINSAQTVFNSPPYKGDLFFKSGKSKGCQPGDIIKGNFDLSQNSYHCKGDITVTWKEGNKANIQWEITNSADYICPITTRHWAIETYPVKK